MSHSPASQNLPASERKGRNAAEVAQQMAPFALYAAIPILLTICIAFYFGSK